MGESANLLSVGAVDFGIIVDSAVILVENIFKNFQRPPEERNVLLQRLSDGFWGHDPTRAPDHVTQAQGWTDRLRLILVSAMQVDKAVLFSALITVAGFVPLFTMQGVEGQIFRPYGANLRICVSRRSDCDLHDHTCDRFVSAAWPRERG